MAEDKKFCYDPKSENRIREKLVKTGWKSWRQKWRKTVIG